MGPIYQLYFRHLGCTDARKYYSRLSGLSETKTNSAQTGAGTGVELGKKYDNHLQQIWKSYPVSFDLLKPVLAKLSQNQKSELKAP